MKIKKIILIVLAAALIVSSTACSASNSADLSSGKGTAAAEGTAAAGEEIMDEAGRGEEAESPVADGDYMEDSVSIDGVGGSSSDGTQTNITAGLLTAGEWNDNLHWSFWQDLYQLNSEWETIRKKWNKTYAERVYATVTNGGKPLENAKVVLSDEQGDTIWTAVTDNDGKCYLFYPSSETGAKKVTASLGAAKKTSDLNGNIAAIDLESSSDATKSLDLMLVFDTTGSMGDELAYLQKELEDVINTVVKNNANLPTRLSVNFYRDDADEYVVKPFDFTNDITGAIKALNEQVADGGGDTPEKVNAALSNAINEHQWDQNSTKLLFIILDAPPHSESAEAVEQMNTLTAQAAEKGIRIIPIVSSGSDKETEYLMRDMAIKTGGTYIFLTSDSGIGGEHMIPTIGDYKVEKLNELLVRVIDGYLSDRTSAPEYSDIEVELPEIEIQTDQNQQTEQTEPDRTDYPYGIKAMEVTKGETVSYCTYESGEIKNFLEWVDSHKTTELDKKPDIGDNIDIEHYKFFMTDGTVQELDVTEDKAYVYYNSVWYAVQELSDSVGGGGIFTSGAAVME